MRCDRGEAERRAEVRRAARGWHRAGAIDDTALTSLEAAYPDDRVRVGPVLRVLLFAFALLAVNAAFGFVWLVLELDPDETVFPVLAFGYAGALVAGTELLTGRLRRAQWGVEAAMSLAAIGYLAAGWFWLCLHGSDFLEEYVVGGTLAVLTAAAAAAAWRWGFSWYGAAAAALGLALLARVPFGRGLWIVAALLLCPLFIRWADSPRLAPGHRESFLLAAVVGIAALYGAVNLGSLDGYWVEILGGRRISGPPVPQGLRAVSIAGTALLPLALLAWGIRSRRRSVLVCGGFATVLSLATWRGYEPFAPVWLCLTLLGALAVACALALRKRLEPERGGFTSDALFADLEEQKLLEQAATVLTLTPEAAPQQERFRGGGGEFGGGGSSSEF